MDKLPGTGQDFMFCSGYFYPRLSFDLWYHRVLFLLRFATIKVGLYCHKEGSYSERSREILLGASKEGHLSHINIPNQDEQRTSRLTSVS